MTAYDDSWIYDNYDYMEDDLHCLDEDYGYNEDDLHCLDEDYDDDEDEEIMRQYRKDLL